jgi:hypothetical protein
LPGTLQRSTLHHDDSVNDREEGGILDIAYRNTKELWRNEYGVDYAVDGGMYRGKPPSPYFQEKWTATEMHILMPVAVEMGASSTSPSRTPTQWASLNGLTSDGRPAFILTRTQQKAQLKGMPHKEDYILGRYRETGYYHIGDT